MQIGEPSWKIIWKFRKKLKVKLPYDPVISQLGIYQQQQQKKKNEELIEKYTCTPMFIAALLIIAKICKQSKCPPIDE